MRQRQISFFLVINIVLLNTFCSFGQSSPNAEALKKSILTDNRLDTVQARALRVLRGFTAGSSYGEIWIRDFNTFIKGSLKVYPRETVKEKLLFFLKMQGKDGNIADGLIDKSKANAGYAYRYSNLLPEWAAHKNTVETDQESSLLQAFAKYISYTKDMEVLNMVIDGKTVVQRLEEALIYILNDRWSARYGLVTGATTIDWGDVQPETGWGVSINEKTKWAIDIYDNAMYAMAIDAFLKICPADYQVSRNWRKIRSGLKKNVRKYLWDRERKKYKPHLYLDGSPFKKEFDEAGILYSGGSICAVLAGFNTKAEVAEINRQLVEAAKLENHATIGFTVSPPYPLEAFPNMAPYTYQNGGDWTWFGGRMIEGLVRYGFVEDAYREITPMIERTISNNGFFEWYNVQTGEPEGSGEYRGEAGVLYDAIDYLRLWAQGK